MFSLGVDIADKKFDISLYDTVTKKHIIQASFINGEAGFIDCYNQIKEKSGDLKALTVFMESTGGLEEPLYNFFNQKVKDCYILNPQQAKNFKKALFIDQKTDNIDAKALALMIILPQLQKSLKTQNDEMSQTLISLISQREFLIKENTRAVLRKLRISKTKVDGTKDFLVLQLDRNIEHLTEEILIIDKEIMKQIKKNPKYLKNYELLKEIPGIGDKTAKILVSYLGLNADLFSSAEKFAAYAGLYPTENQSGNHVGQAKLTYKGCRKLKSSLYNCALAAIKNENKLHEYYLQKIASGKSKKQILIAISNKLAKLSWSIIKYQKRYDNSKFMPNLA